MPSRRFRPRSAAVAVVAWLAVCVGWVWLAARDGGADGALHAVPQILFGTALVWALLVRPSVDVDERGVHLRNLVRDVDVPWARLESVETRFALTLRTTDGRRFAAWAAPASGRYADVRMSSREAKTLGLGGDEPTASASWVARSGAAAAWVRREWRRALDRDLPDEAVTVTVCAPVVAAVGGATVLLVVGALVG